MQLSFVFWGTFAVCTILPASHGASDGLILTWYFDLVDLLARDTSIFFNCGIFDVLNLHRNLLLMILCGLDLQVVLLTLFCLLNDLSVNLNRVSFLVRYIHNDLRITDQSLMLFYLVFGLCGLSVFL